MTEEFKLAPVDKNSKIVTAIFVIGGILTLGFCYLIPFLFSPRRYRVTNDGIIIHTPVTSQIIPKETIKSIKMIGSVTPGTGLNWMGGLFGYAGEFALKSGSVAKVYATSWTNMVQIDTYKGDPYLLSPADPKSFITSVEELIN